MTAYNIFNHAINVNNQLNPIASGSIRIGAWTDMSESEPFKDYSSIEEYLNVDVETIEGHKRLEIAMNGLLDYYKKHSIPITNEFWQIHTICTSSPFSPKDVFGVSLQTRGRSQAIMQGELAINTVKAVVEHLGFEGIDRAHGEEEVNKSIKILIEYFNCCKSRYLTTAGAEE